MRTSFFGSSREQPISAAWDKKQSGKLMSGTDERLKDLRNRKARSEAGGGQARVDAQHNRGK